MARDEDAERGSEKAEDHPEDHAEDDGTGAANRRRTGNACPHGRDEAEQQELWERASALNVRCHGQAIPRLCFRQSSGINAEHWPDR
jgi:hypothetical protein